MIERVRGKVQITGREIGEKQDRETARTRRRRRRRREKTLTYTSFVSFDYRQVRC